MKSDWTVCIMLTILMGSLPGVVYSQADKVRDRKRPGEAVTVEKNIRPEQVKEEKKKTELKAQLDCVKEELSFVRKELATVLAESDKREADYARLKASIAASLAEGSKKSYDKESVELMKALTEVSEKGEKLVSASAEFCDFIETLLNKKGELSDVERARARFRMDKLKSVTEIFHARIKTPSDEKLFNSCRILTINDKLQVAVLNVGSVYGMRNGILLKTGDKKNPIQLTVIAVRPFISGAVITEGSIEGLAPGMVVYTGQ